MSCIVPRDKPKTCKYCNFMDRISFDCRLTVADYPDFYSQYANCPLVELPPHGRLIDADKLMRDIEKYHLSDGKFQHWVEVQQTIIEAEGSEE